MLEFLAEASETVVGVWRIAMELRKTQRQVKALENVRMPRIEATIAHIEDQLEEQEREEIVTTKKLKERQ